jgi:hypothetical protein
MTVPDLQVGRSSDAEAYEDAGFRWSLVIAD